MLARCLTTCVKTYTTIGCLTATCLSGSKNEKECLESLDYGNKYNRKQVDVNRKLNYISLLLPYPKGIGVSATRKHMKDVSGIYKITNTINGKYYIGSSYRCKHRWQEHKRDLRRNKHHNPYLQAAWNKNTEAAFTFEIIKDIPRDNIRKAEQWLLSFKQLDHPSVKGWMNETEYRKWELQRDLRLLREIIADKRLELNRPIQEARRVARKEARALYLITHAEEIRKKQCDSGVFTRRCPKCNKVLTHTSKAWCIHHRHCSMSM